MTSKKNRSKSKANNKDRSSQKKGTKIKWALKKGVFGFMEKIWDKLMEKIVDWLITAIITVIATIGSFKAFSSQDRNPSLDLKTNTLCPAVQLTP